MRRLDGRGACAVGDLSDPDLEGFRCWITSGSDTATLSCLRPLAGAAIEAARTGWSKATPQYVRSLRSAALCPASNGRSGYAALTLQGMVLDEFVRPEFGFVTGLGTRLSTLERLVQTFGTGDPLLPWDGGTPVGVETYALTACIDGAACDPDAIEAARATPEGWNVTSIPGAARPGPQGTVAVVSMVEVGFRRVAAPAPGEPLEAGCAGALYGEVCPFTEEGIAFVDDLHVALSAEGFADMRSALPPDEFEGYLGMMAAQMPAMLEAQAQDTALPYAWRRHRPASNPEEMADTLVEGVRTGRLKLYLRELRACPFGGAAILFVFSDMEDDGRVSDFSSLVMSMWLSSCDAGRTADADAYVTDLIIETAEEQRP